MKQNETKQNQRYNFTVKVKTAFIEEHSLPEERRFVFAYTISITNNGSIAGRLVRRHWIITDANNNRQEVHGEGVVGERPYLNPGQTYQYTSGAVIETPVGYMQGHYDIVADDGVEFDSPIEPFSLATPNTLH